MAAPADQQLWNDDAEVFYGCGGNSKQTTLVELRAMHAEGVVDDQTDVWLEGLDEWFEIKDLRQQLGFIGPQKEAMSAASGPRHIGSLIDSIKVASAQVLSSSCPGACSGKLRCAGGQCK